MNTTNNQMLKKSAKYAGFLYFLLIPTGMFGLVYVPGAIIAPGDMATTIANMISSEILYRFGIVATLLMNLVSIALVLELYKLFKNISGHAAMYMLVFLIPGATISMTGGAFSLAALELSFGGDLSFFVAGSSGFWVQLFLDMQYSLSQVAAIFWGMWLFPLGYLVIKSRFMPKVLGVLLIVAGIGYLIDVGFYFLMPEFGFTFSDFTFVGEVTFMFWLVFKGVDLSAGPVRSSAG